MPNVNRRELAAEVNERTKRLEEDAEVEVAHALAVHGALQVDEGVAPDQGVDADGGVSTATDECLINYVRTFGTNARTVAIDKNNNLWVGGLGNQWHEEIDGVTGQHVPGSEFNLGCGGYGGFIDSRGVLWSARGGNGLLRYDTSGMDDGSRWAVSWLG